MGWEWKEGELNGKPRMNENSNNKGYIMNEDKGTLIISVLVALYLLYAMVVFEMTKDEPKTTIKCNNVNIEHFMIDHFDIVTDLQSGKTYYRSECNQ